MNLKEAQEILKPYEMYKTFPLFWLKKDSEGNISPMSIAEAKGYLEAIEQIKPVVEALKDLLMHGSPVPDKDGNPVPYQANPFEAEKVLQLYRKIVGEKE